MGDEHTCGSSSVSDCTPPKQERQPVFVVGVLVFFGENMEEQKKTAQHRNPIDVIIRAARLYREHLSGNVFLYAFGNQCIEVEFPDWSFKHLAGVNVKLSADRFFRQAADGKSFRVWFSKRHPHDLFLRKARHLHEIHKLTQSDCLVLETIHTKSREEAPFDFGLTNHDFTLCLGQNADTKGKLRNLHVVPYSLREEDGCRRSEKQHPIAFILRKRADQKRYDTVCFLKAGRMKQIPKDIQQKMDSGLLHAVCDFQKLKDWQTARKAFLQTFLPELLGISTSQKRNVENVLVKAAQQSLIHDGLQEDVKDYIDKYAPFTMRGENDLGQRILDKALQHPAVVKVTNPERDDGRS